MGNIIRFQIGLKEGRILAFIAVLVLAVLELPAQSFVLQLINLEDEKQIGECSIQTRVLSDQVTEIEYSFSRKVNPNPYAGSYSYQVVKKDGQIFLDMLSVLTDLEAHVDPSLQVVYSGDQIDYPVEFVTGVTLPNRQGFFQITKPGAKVGIRYAVVLTNRRIVDVKEIEINGETFNAFKVRYDLSQENSVQNKSMFTSEQSLEDWIIPEFGVVERTRTGSVKHSHMNITLNQQTLLDRK